GEYTFWISSDDKSELWLSADEDPAKAIKIASVPSSAQGSFTKHTEQQSVPVLLQGGGTKYYISALHKEGLYDDYVKVAWQGPGLGMRIIEGIDLEAYGGGAVPSQPGILRAEAKSSIRADLSWMDNAHNEMGYTIERKTGSAGFSKIANLGPNATAYIDLGLVAGQTYHYRVRSFNGYGESAWSDDASATTLSSSSPIDRTDEPGGLITASGEKPEAGEGKAQAFDNLSNTKWFTATDTAWIQYQFAAGNQYAISAYTITSANDAPARDPMNWKVYGSNNGADHTLIDTRTGISFSERYEKQYFFMDNATAYNYYRFELVSDVAQCCLQLAEIELFDKRGGIINVPPSTAITSPANGTEIKYNGEENSTTNILIEATAADSDGSISKVSFYNGNTLLGEDTSSPYSYNWTGVAPGNYNLSTKATDSNGGFAYSDFVNLTVSTIGFPLIHSVSGQSSDGAATNLIDGKIMDVSRWAVQTYPQWIVLDYGAVKSFTGTRLYTYQSRAYRYKVEMSQDTIFNEPVVVNRLNNTSGAQPIADDFAVVQARYVKITVEGAYNYTGTWISLNEFVAEIVPTSFTITASAGPNGAIAPEGNVTVVQGEEQSFTVTSQCRV
ncbi:MAG: hypothetical protein HC896_16330, partial [Bacteroidales bacterium]|nr:hypothetical protein [Bacteroidales bacterium]